MAAISSPTVRSGVCRNRSTACDRAPTSAATIACPTASASLRKTCPAYGVPLDQPVIRHRTPLPSKLRVLA
jgi:hypothetical protein